MNTTSYCNNRLCRVLVAVLPLLVVSGGANADYPQQSGDWVIDIYRPEAPTDPIAVQSGESPEGPPAQEAPARSAAERAAAPAESVAAAAQRKLPHCFLYQKAIRAAGSVPAWAKKLSPPELFITRMKIDTVPVWIISIAAKTIAGAPPGTQVFVEIGSRKVTFLTVGLKNKEDALYALFAEKALADTTGQPLEDIPGPDDFLRSLRLGSLLWITMHEPNKDSKKLYTVSLSQPSSSKKAMRKLDECWALLESEED